MKESIKVQIGEFTEGYPWEIKFNYAGSEGKPCKHCGPIISNPIGNYWICPRVIRATNEGGYNHTAVCLDCILEESQKIK